MTKAILIPDITRAIGIFVFQHNESQNVQR